jgi:uncharacterized Tic20 family protein
VNDPSPPAGGADTGDVGAPGWYPAEDGFVRWWDGSGWGPPRPAGATTNPRRDEAEAGRQRAPLPHATPGDHARTVAILTHLGFVLGGFIMPLAVYRIERANPYLRHHAAEALNFQITFALVVLVSLPLMLIVVGFVTLLLAVIANVVLGVVGAVQAARGVWWRYPVNLRLIRP